MIETLPVYSEAPDPTWVKPGASPEPQLPERPDTPRGQALEYREPETGRLASALVYLVDTLREKWGMNEH